MTSLESSIIALVGVVVSLVVGLGVVESQTAGYITSAAGIIVSIVFQIIAANEHKAKITAGIVNK